MPSDDKAEFGVISVVIDRERWKWIQRANCGDLCVIGRCERELGGWEGNVSLCVFVPKCESRRSRALGGEIWHFVMWHMNCIHDIELNHLFRVTVNTHHHQNMGSVERGHSWHGGPEAHLPCCFRRATPPLVQLRKNSLFLARLKAKSMRRLGYLVAPSLGELERHVHESLMLVLLLSVWDASFI